MMIWYLIIQSQPKERGVILYFVDLPGFGLLYAGKILKFDGVIYATHWFHLQAVMPWCWQQDNKHILACESSHRVFPTNSQILLGIEWFLRGVVYSPARTTIEDVLVLDRFNGAKAESRLCSFPFFPLAGQIMLDTNLAMRKLICKMEGAGKHTPTYVRWVQKMKEQKKKKKKKRKNVCNGENQIMEK